MLEEALRYERMGFSVIPVNHVGARGCTCGLKDCKSQGKHPVGDWKRAQEHRLTPPDLQKIFADKSPKRNVGIVTGPVSGIYVLDIDGEKGLDSLARAGHPIESLPTTPTVRTGGGGYHLYFRYPEWEVKSKTEILGAGSKVDVRGLGGFVVAPPSDHKSGKRYEWVEGRGLEIPIAEFDLRSILPQEEKKSIRIRTRTKTAWHTQLFASGSDEGKRNSDATKLFGYYLSSRIGSEGARHLVRDYNTRNKPPLSDSELEQIFESVEKADSKVQTLEWASGVLRMEILSCRWVTGDVPKLLIEFPEGMCQLSSDDILSPAAFQKAVLAATKTIIPRLSEATNPTHSKLAQALISNAVNVDAGAEATEVGMVRTAIRSYLAGLPELIDLKNGDKAPNRGAFACDGLIWMAIQDVTVRMTRAPTTPMLAQRMGELGMVNREFMTVLGDTRSVWGISKSEVKSDSGV